MTEKLQSRLAVAISLLPWLPLYGWLQVHRANVVAAKVHSEYDGWCVKPSGYRLQCTFEQWLQWDPAPGMSGMITFASAILAASLSTWLFLRFSPETPLVTSLKKLIQTSLERHHRNPDASK